MPLYLHQYLALWEKYAFSDFFLFVADKYFPKGYFALLSSNPTTSTASPVVG